MTFNEQGQIMVAAAFAKRRERAAETRSVCIYYAGERCYSEMRPRCPHYDDGACKGRGDCNNFCAHYSTPPQILREEAMGV